MKGTSTNLVLRVREHSEGVVNGAAKDFVGCLAKPLDKCALMLDKCENNGVATRPPK